MCLKNVNANIRIYSDVETSINGDPAKFVLPFDGMHISQNDCGQYQTVGFKIVTHFNLIGTATEAHQKDNIVNSHGKLYAVIRLTKCSKDEEERLSVDLDQFEIDVSKLDDMVNRACFPYLNFTRITDVKPMELGAGLGTYVIKLLLKTKEEEKYTVQSMYQLTIENIQ